MQRPRDPIQRVADGSRDLYDVVTWEERTRLDSYASTIYYGLLAVARAVVVLLAVLILLAQLTLTGLATLDNPMLGAYILLSVVPALLLAAYVRRADVTMREPLRLLVLTFMLGFLFAGFAAVVNTAVEDAFAAVPVVGLVLFFYLVVGPVEETVKLLAVRLYAYRSDRLDAVVDGAVYGAVAGLGFATIENTIYITQQSMATVGTLGGDLVGVTAARTVAGPGHVIYSAFAGYYLGLAKFNPRDRGPIVVKGLLVAVLIHGTYNTMVAFLPVLKAAVPTLAGLPDGTVFISFVLAYDGAFGYLLYRKLARYRATYRDLGAERTQHPGTDAAEVGVDAVDPADAVAEPEAALDAHGDGVDAASDGPDAPGGDREHRASDGDGYE
jgi:RsiW-degrading membrane proteinase PrsW (M82 family)